MSEITETTTDDEIETGERIMESPITGKTYLVTKWLDKGDGTFTALEKEEIGKDQSET